MKINLLLSILQNKNNITFMCPDRKPIPYHMHITEVAKVEKDFYDCGGIRRKKSYATIQVWVGNDVEHRLSSQKLINILENLSECDRDLELFVEYDFTTVGLYRIDEIIIPMQQNMSNYDIIIQLARTTTDCLAPEKCGLKQSKNTCSTGCC
jgi:hypothetical protein